MDWLIKLFTETSIAQSVVIYGLVIAIGIWLGRLKIAGIALGVTWVLFVGLIFSYCGLMIDKGTEDFLKEFGLILFVYSVGLQVGPGFFASLKKNVFTNNILAAAVVISGVLITIGLYYLSGNHISIMAGVMSGAVTNTPGLAAAQATVSDLHLSVTNKSLITLAYAVTYPLGVFGIISSLLLLKKFFSVKTEREQEFHRKLSVIRANRPVSIHLHLANKQLIGQPLRKLFDLLKEPIVVSRMLHKNDIITPTPATILAENDVLLIVASRKTIEQLKLLVGPPAITDLRKAPESELQSAFIIVTNATVTHKRLGDIPELHQHDFTFTRLNRAGIEMVPHGDIFLQLGDTVKIVGTKEGIEYVTKVMGNSLKKLEIPDLAPIFIGIVLGVILGSIPFHLPNIPVAVKIGMAGGPLIAALTLSRFGNLLYLNNYTTNSANLMIREVGISLFLASVGLSSGKNLSVAFTDGKAWIWMLMGIIITIIPLLIIGFVAKKGFRKTYFEICGLLAGASTDPPALAFATKMSGSDIPSVTYATVYPIAMILRIVTAQLLILLFS
ncbi:MAG TPA: putative transporter [Chitinophagaceae bacterium]|nr:putative transporter [Chitinophagaceae bacterium]